jgi:hypothetical protein
MPAAEQIAAGAASRRRAASGRRSRRRQASSAPGRCSRSRWPSAYVTKPTGFDLFIDAIRTVDNFYLALARLPH